jgi:hypothetical protein
LDQPLCPDITWISMNITAVSGSYITYNYTIKNTGTDTLFINKIVIQNYTSADSSFNTSPMSAAGGAYINISTDKYILPDSFFSAEFYANPMVPIATKPYLAAQIYLVSGTECNVNDNIVVRKIPIINSSKSIHSSYSTLLWNSKTKSFYIPANNANLKFKVYNSLGKEVYSGMLQNDNPVSLPLHSGAYIIKVFGDKRTLNRTITIE